MFVRLLCIEFARGAGIVKNYAGYAALAMFEHTAVVIRETDKAVLVNFNVFIDNVYINRDVWIAKSIIKVN